MAITVANLVEAQSTADGSGQGIIGVTLDAGKAYLLTIAAFNSTSQQPAVNVFSHGNWELVSSIDFDTVPVNLGTLAVYKHVDAAVASHTLTVTFTNTIHAFCASIDEITGCDLTNPFPQWVGREDNVTPETTGTLGTMVDSDSRSFVALAKNSAVASIYTMDTNWALLTEGSVSGPTLHLTTCWSDADGAATSASFVQSTGSQTAGNIIVEIASGFPAYRLFGDDLFGDGVFGGETLVPDASVTIEPEPGTFSFAGAAPLVSVLPGAVNVGPLPGAFSFVGTAPTVSVTSNATVVAPAGAFSFSAPAPTIEGTLSDDDEVPAGGPSLRRRFIFWDYRHPATEKSLKDR